MARYIDADKLVEELKDASKKFKINGVAEAILNDTITLVTFFPHNEDCSLFKNKADYVEVKHGEWERKSNDSVYWYVCSECQNDIPRNKYGGWSFPHYCPNCGAEMDGRNDK